MFQIKSSKANQIIFKKDNQLWLQDIFDSTLSCELEKKDRYVSFYSEIIFHTNFSQVQ